jgi:hypothetical protein
MEKKELKDVIDKIKPFDIVFFSGNGIASDLIKFVQSILLNNEKDNNFVKPGEFSHVGMIITSEVVDYPGVEEGIIYLLESTISGFGKGKAKDISGKPFFGVQIRRLEEVMEDYKTEIAIGNLINNPLLKENIDIKEIKEKFSNIVRTLLYTDYEYNLVSLGSSLIEELRPFRNFTNKIMNTERNLFCSELVATILQKLNIIDEKVEVQNIVPMDLLGFDRDKIEKGGIPRLVNLPLIFVAKPIHLK